MSPIYIEGRRVYVRAGSKTQTIRVCTEENQQGTWAHEFRLLERRVTAAQVAAWAEIRELAEWLRGLGARDERSRPASGSGKPVQLTPAVPADPSWLSEAVPAVEAAIDALVLEFIDHPYLHRVEHSLHVRLCELLAAHPVLRRRAAIGVSGRTTQPLHKEWPETRPRPHKNGKRGNFDLVVLSPNQLASSTLLDFQRGRIAAPIVIELGLDYGYDHLEGDHGKLLNSAVPAGYLVDFRRTGAPDAPTRDLVLRPTHPIKTAYVHHGPAGGYIFKSVNDSALRHTK